ncbi:MAG: DEAD/DEAH box helicase [Fibrobacteria bacterium]|nr:DEAD/DEAH box helicase [Fibrobacteria bacterium]
MAAIDPFEILAGLSVKRRREILATAFPARATWIRRAADPAEWARTHLSDVQVLQALPFDLIKKALRENGSLLESFPAPIPRPPAEPASAAPSPAIPVARWTTEVAESSTVLVQRARQYVEGLETPRWDPGRRAWVSVAHGTQEYQVALGIRSYDDDCTCPYFEEHGDCKHAIALRMRMLRGEIGQVAPLDRAAPLVGKAVPPAQGRWGTVSFPVGDDPARKRLPKNLFRLGFLLEEASPRSLHNRNPAKRVVYLLRTREDAFRSRRVEVEVVPQCESETKIRGWTLETSDLRKTFTMGRLRDNPPLYLSPFDQEAIEKCGVGIGSYGGGSRWLSSPLPLLRMLHGAGRLRDQDNRTLVVDERLWLPRYQAELESEELAWKVRLENLEDRAETVLLDPQWRWFDSGGELAILAGRTVYQLDPRTGRGSLEMAATASLLAREEIEEHLDVVRPLSRMGFSLPPQWCAPIRREEPSPHLEVRAMADRAVLVPRIAYPSTGILREATGRILSLTDSEGILVDLERDLEAEAALLTGFAGNLESAGIEATALDGEWVVESPGSLRRLALGGLEKLVANGWTLLEPPGLDRWKRRTGVFHARMAGSGKDWFELGGEVDFDGIRLPLATLVRSHGEITLADGSVGEVPRGLLRRLRWMDSVGSRTSDGIRLSAQQAVLASELLDSGLAVVDDPSSWKARLEASLSVPPVAVDPPPGLVADLRSYQLAGLRWMASLRERRLGGILADDMGLGKTIQVIALLCRIFQEDPQAAPALVVAPASVVGNWVAEIERFAPRLVPRLLHGSDRHEEDLDAALPGTVWITTYGIVPKDREKLSGRTFSLLVLDESQNVRNPQTLAHRACASLKALQTLCLTGTPIENSLLDLWAQFHLLNPGLLGPREVFLEQFTPDEDDPAPLERLRVLTSPFWLRRTKELVAPELPERTDVLLTVDLDPRQMALYRRQLQEFQKHLLPRVQREGLDQGGRFEVLTALLRLRQIACAPALAGHRGPATKVDLLVEKLSEVVAEGHRALVFSSFTALLDLVERALDRASLVSLRFDGSTPARDRTARIRAFQSGSADVFLISLKAGNAGINLTEADAVFLLDPWWNPASEEQAAARAHRIGRTRPVTVYRMVARGTIEERVLELSRAKSGMARDLFDAGETGGVEITADMVADLLGG